MGGRGEVISEGQQDSEVINLRRYFWMEIDSPQNPRWRRAGDSTDVCCVLQEQRNVGKTMIGYGKKNFETMKQCIIFQ